jgi:hypothetical protein
MEGSVPESVVNPPTVLATTRTWIPAFAGMTKREAWMPHQVRHDTTSDMCHDILEGVQDDAFRGHAGQHTKGPRQYRGEREWMASPQKKTGGW